MINCNAAKLRFFSKIRTLETPVLFVSRFQQNINTFFVFWLTSPRHKQRMHYISLFFLNYHFLQIELMAQRKDDRERFGYQVDFEDYKPPFQSHVDDLVVTMEKT